VAKVPTKSEQESYRLSFFIIAQLIMGSMIWLCFQETFTRRPWKDFQIRWWAMEKSRAEKNLEGEKSWLKTGVEKRQVDGQDVEVKLPERIAELNKTVTELEGAIVDTPKRVEFEKLKDDLKKAEIALKDGEINLAFAKAEEDEYYYYYRNAKHHENEDAEKKFEKRYEELHQRVLDRSKEYDDLSAKRDAVSDKVNEIQGKLNKAKKELAELTDGEAGAQRALDAIANRFKSPVEALLNGDGKIEQFWNQSIDLVDRCHTCHEGYNKCGFTAPKEIVETIIAEPTADQAALRKRFCVTRDEANRYIAAAAKIKDSWGGADELDFEKVKPDLKLEEDPLVAAATKMKVPVKEAEALYRTHPHFTPLLTQHSPEVYGCTTCHYGQGRETKGEGLNYLAGEFAPFDHSKHNHYWEVQMLDTSNHQVEASCFNCHQQDYELKYAEHFTEARKLVQHLGCTGCHPLGALEPERKHGPSLAKVTGKIDPGFMLAWIQYPRAIRPRTRMPNFWPSALKDGKPDPTASRCDEFDYTRGAPPSPSVYANCIDIREKESSYIVAYLTKMAKPDKYPSMPSSASAARGKEVFEHVGCQGCHNLGDWAEASHMPGSKDRDLAPNLTSIGDKIKNPGWIHDWVSNPKSYWHETRMPRLRLTDQEAWDVAAYLSSQKSSGPYAISPKAKAYMDEEGAPDKGKKLIAYYGCFGCHEISGFETMARVGADLTEFGSKSTQKLDYGDVPEFAHDPRHAETWIGWITRKLSDPRAFRYERAASRMPQFDVSKEELANAILFLKSQNDVTKKWPASVRHTPTREQAAINRGAFLIDAYNCRGCHMIDDRGVDVDHDHVIDGGDIYKRLVNDEDMKFRAPPKLIREGAKVYPDWLFGFLKSPFKLRENYKIRMPTFQFTDEQAGDLVAYFAAKAGTGYPYLEKKRDHLTPEDDATAKKLFAEAQCLSCHNLGDNKTIDPKNVAPNLRLAAARLQYDWLFHWLKNPQEQAPGVGMPNFFAPIDDKPGEYETPLTDIAGGDWKRQIELLRALVYQFGDSQSAPLAEAPAKKEKKTRVR
jgi:mono/diheme cytochrome c family protein